MLVNVVVANAGICFATYRRACSISVYICHLSVVSDASRVKSGLAELKAMFVADENNFSHMRFNMRMQIRKQLRFLKLQLYNSVAYAHSKKYYCVHEAIPVDFFPT